MKPMVSQEEGLSFDNVATQLEVSVASVRNWVKTGYLVQIGKGLVSLKSFKEFLATVAGSEKLIARANKSLKDYHDHEELLQKYHSLIDENDINGYDLGHKYEEALSSSYRNKEGVFYTPFEVINKFFDYLPKDCSKMSFCDPCCGSGNFIIAAIENGILPENIYGYDIDSFAVEVTKKRIFELTGYKTDNIRLVDFLESSLNKNNDAYDIIFTNPPWGKKIPKNKKNLYATTLGAGKSVDTSSLFFFSCLSRLVEGGYLGFLLQDAFFNVAVYEQARVKALELNILAIMDFGKPFKGLLTKAKGLVIKNSKMGKKSVVECSNLAGNYSRLQSSFLLNPKCILNSKALEEEAETIAHLYSLSHVTLSGKASWGLGIVTGNNKKFIKDAPAKGYVAAYKGSDIKEGVIASPSSYIPSNLALYQQVAPLELYQAAEKLLYKFISSRLVFFCDQEQRYVLNSANMLIPDPDFPITQIQLSQILNSKVMNWLFRTIFDTYKVLRSDIEVLPIHVGYFKKNSIFEEAKFNEYLKVEELEDGTFRIKK